MNFCGKQSPIFEIKQSITSNNHKIVTVGIMLLYIIDQ